MCAGDIPLRAARGQSTRPSTARRPRGPLRRQSACHPARRRRRAQCGLRWPGRVTVAARMIFGFERDRRRLVTSASFSRPRGPSVCWRAAHGEHERPAACLREQGRIPVQGAGPCHDSDGGRRWAVVLGGTVPAATSTTSATERIRANTSASAVTPRGPDTPFRRRVIDSADHGRPYAGRRTGV